MPYNENLKKATALKKELDGYRPLTPEVEQRIMQKFRLDWNYHSSHIEGNLLTYGETKALILFGVTAQAKPLKDHLEMTGHNEAIKYIEEIISQERPLTETFIRELHKLILKEPYEVDAITPDKKPTRRMIKIGQYKTVPNHVLTKTDEIFYFASPEETPAKMSDLMQWYNENKDNADIHPVLFATEFHYRFIRIHPFDDGNGRIARLLMNFILMQKGYPPAIIKTGDKETYFAALQQADAGQLEYFFNYVCEQVNHSLELMIKGAKGESIEDEDDLDKRLALLKQEVDAEDKENEIKTQLTLSVIEEALENWGYDLFTELSKTTNKFNAFYNNPNHNLSFTSNNYNSWQKVGENMSFDETKNKFKEFDLNSQLINGVLRFHASFGAYKKGGLNTFGCAYSFEIKFELYHYEVHIGYFEEHQKGQKLKLFTKKLLHKSLSKEEIKEINKQWGDTLFNHLEYFRKRLNKKDIDIFD
jgi:Fic family protein